MELYDAESLARSLMDSHGLNHVPLEWHGRARVFGTCTFNRVGCFGPWYVTAILLSKRLVAINSPEYVRDTILHEIAHALVGPDADHGPLWKAKARELGCKDTGRCGANVTPIPGPYFAECPCGIQHQFYHKPTRGKICRHCRSRLEIKAR